MSDVLADTHAIVWYLFDPRRLSPAAAAALAAAEQSATIFVSTITLVEVNYLSGKKSFPYAGVLPKLYSLIDDPVEPLAALPLSVDVAKALDQVPKAEVPEMPDRIVAATAVAHNVPLVSIDTDIRGSASLKALIQVIW